MEANRSSWGLTALTFIILTIYAHMGYYTFSIGGLEVYYYLPLAALLVLIAAAAFVIRPRIARIQILLSHLWVLLLPLIFALSWSILIWVFRGSSVAEMRRGVVSMMYVFSGICAMAALAYLVGERSWKVQLCSLLAGCGLTMVKTMMEGGVGPFLIEYVELVLSFTAKMGPLIYNMEIHDAMYALGLYLVVFLIRPGMLKKYWWAALLSVFFFLAGLKRIAVLAILAGVFIGAIFIRERWFPQISRFLLRVMAVGFILFAFAFLAISVLGLFAMLEEFGINTMGRQEIAEAFEPYYEFSPLFLGNGLGFVDTVGMEMGYHTHNDYLKRFIELGMIGFIIWCYLQFTFQVSESYKRIDRTGGTIALAMTAFLAVTYATEMIVAMPLANSTFAVILLSYDLSRREEERERHNVLESHRRSELLTRL